MPAGRLLARGIGLAGACFLVGCATHRERARGLPLLDASEVRVVLEEAEAPPGPGAPRWQDQIGGPWQVVEAGSGPFEPPAPPGPQAPPGEALPARCAPTPAEAAPIVKRRESPRPVLPVPRRRAAAEARPEGSASGKTPEQLAREHFLDYPTRVRAEKITFYCPPDYAAEVRLTGANVERFEAHDRRAQGGARLVLRELTLEAERISFKVQEDGAADLQILARGAAGIVSEVRGNVVREEGLRSLVITNDRMVPLR